MLATQAHTSLIYSLEFKAEKTKKRGGVNEGKVSMAKVKKEVSILDLKG